MTRYVLIVEREEDTRDAICESLEDCGVPVRCPPDFESAAELLRAREPPCAVLLGVGPLERDLAEGLTVSLRMQTATVDIPVVVLSSLNALEPFDDRTRVLMKPFDPVLLRDLVCGAAARLA